MYLYVCMLYVENDLACYVRSMNAQNASLNYVQ